MIVSSLDAVDGGPPCAILQLSRSLVDLGHDVTVLTNAHRGRQKHELVSAAGAAGVRFDWVWRRRATRFQLSWRLWVRARRLARGVDVVTSHGFYQFTCWAACNAAVAGGAQLMLQPHGVFEPYQERKSRTLKHIFQVLAGRRILRHVDGIVAASQAEVEGFRATHGRKTPPILVAGLGVDPTSESRHGPVGFGSRRVLFLSRIAPKKRLDKLLGAAQILFDRGRPIQLSVCGDGDPEYLTSLKRQVSREVEVQWAGHVSGHRRLEIEKTQAVLCLPSDNENFGQAVTEAMAAGIPVVTTTATGASEHVIRAHAGWVLSDPTAVELADALDAALGDPRVLTEMSARGIAYARRELTWDAVAIRWINYCQARAS